MNLNLCTDISMRYNNILHVLDENLSASKSIPSCSSPYLHISSVNKVTEQNFQTTNKLFQSLSDDEEVTYTNTESGMNDKSYSTSWVLCAI